MGASVETYVNVMSMPKVNDSVIMPYGGPMSTFRSIINKHRWFTTVRIPSGYSRKHEMSSKRVLEDYRVVTNNLRNTTKSLIDTLDQVGLKVSRSTIDESCI